MATFYMLEGVNLFMGDHDPTASTHLELETLKMPDLEDQNVEHSPGGSVMKVNFTIPQLSALEVSFKLKGFNPKRMREFGIGTVYRKVFTGYGSVRDKRSGQMHQAKAIFEGRIAKMAPDEAKRGDDFGHDFTVMEITSAALYFDEERIYEVDFFTNKYIVGENDQTADFNRALNIPNA